MANIRCGGEITTNKGIKVGDGQETEVPFLKFKTTNDTSDYNTKIAGVNNHINIEATDGLKINEQDLLSHLGFNGWREPECGSKVSGEVYQADATTLVCVWMDSSVSTNISDSSGINFFISQDGENWIKVNRTSSVNGYPKFENVSYVVPKGIYYYWNVWGSINSIQYSKLRLTKV